MVVLQLTSDYPPDPLWGMGWHVYFLTKTLREKGINVYVGTASKSVNFDTSIISTNPEDDKRFLSSEEYEIFNDFSHFNKWQEKLAEKVIDSKVKPDVIHCHNWMSWITAKNIKRIYSNVKIITTFHLLQRQYELMVENPIPSFNSYIIEIEKEAARLSNNVIVLSESQQDILTTKYGGTLDKGKVSIISSGVDFKLNNYSEVRKIRDSSEIIDITFVGRLEEDKGIKFLLQAFARLLKDNDKVRLNIVGKGPLHQELMKLYSSDKIVFHGFLQRNEVENLLRKSSIFCMPSTSESLATAVIEAMVFGVVPVFSKGKSVPNLFEENVHGLKIPLYYKDKKYLPNVDDIYENLKLLVSDRKLLNKLSYNAYVFANSNFTLDRMADKIIKLYKDQKFSE
jgi:glycogen(starch) synthase